MFSSVYISHVTTIQIKIQTIYIIPESPFVPLLSLPPSSSEIINIQSSINIDSEDTMILIRFYREVGENYPKVTEVSIQWPNEMKCLLNLRNKIALCLTQGLIRKTTWQGSWKAGTLSQMERYGLWSHLKKVAYSSPLSVWHKYPVSLERRAGWRWVQHRLMH